MRGQVRLGQLRLLCTWAAVIPAPPPRISEPAPFSVVRGATRFVSLVAQGSRFVLFSRRVFTQLVSVQAFCAYVGSLQPIRGKILVSACHCQHFASVTRLHAALRCSPAELKGQPVTRRQLTLRLQG